MILSTAERMHSVTLIVIVTDLEFVLVTDVERERVPVAVNRKREREYRRTR